MNKIIYFKFLFLFFLYPISSLVYKCYYLNHYCALRKNIYGAKFVEILTIHSKSLNS